ncbi:GntR family transcriptional regulator [Allokutzneria sp. A3M-2-11 16]|uniref:GntR family transcriptional regulator n=1 Tax=Allokutzneria sp. A3M-2-11 16 TaxID=2962043 RepID=UPI0020B79282|nr:GntR family transcriptional regulator [Allokutzneria sp. A3M-2-11 16]MCP3805332.1 GntR family transcriptional regulator [Allokutzneria sp. A3M-2-11 16]
MTDSPPYARIVAELRRRITEGELAPGDRLPSTRQIAIRWGVALATATKALTTLKQEGLIVAEPRVGTVVAVAPTKPRPPVELGDELSRDRIVRAAVEIADAEGLAAVSMRGVAAKLGVSAMSPYRHVDGKDDLVLLMVDAAYGELEPPDPKIKSWRARAETGSRGLWALYRRHPWLAQFTTLTRPVMLPNLAVHADWMITALSAPGRTPTQVMNLHVLLFSYVQGIAVNLEREAHARAATGLTEEEWMDTQAEQYRLVRESGRFPAFSGLMRAFDEEGYDLDLDEIFELGLAALLDGIR